MPYKMKLLRRDPSGMQFIWNISAHVGICNRHSNRATDVELVQHLLIAESKSKDALAQTIGLLGLRINANGIMDMQTALAIIDTGQSTDALKTIEVVSPARGGVTMYGHETMTIGYLNANVRHTRKDYWESLPDICSPALKRELITKTSP